MPCRHRLRSWHAILTTPMRSSTCPLAEIGSVYQQKVWAAIAQIPRGQVRTYGDVARFIGSAPRAVGQVPAVPTGFRW